MFKRIKEKSLSKKILGFFWPEGGWRRYGQYLLIRLNRLKGTPRSIAAGVACGVAISFTPFVGFHFALAALTAWLVRGNIIASALGTIAGNPWTFPFIWMSTLYTGRYFLGMNNLESKVDFIKFFEKLFHSIIDLDLMSSFHEIWPILKPMMLGSIPFYLFSWFLSYFLVKKALETVEKKRRRKKQESL